jgi:hypothetical protein
MGKESVFNTVPCKKINPLAKGVMPGRLISENKLPLFYLSSL